MAVCVGSSVCDGVLSAFAAVLRRGGPTAANTRGGESPRVSSREGWPSPAPLVARSPPTGQATAVEIRGKVILRQTRVEQQ